MKTPVNYSSVLFRYSVLLAAVLCAGAASVQAEHFSAYYTIQPNAASNAVVHTLSWAALDTQFAAGSVYDNPGTTNINEGSKDKINRNTPFGNASSTLDDVNTMGEANYTFDNTANGGSATTVVRYRHTANGGNPVSNITTAVYYQNPLITTLGIFAPSISTPKWDDVGDFTYRGNMNFGVGVQGVTGFRAANPDGTGVSPLGVGIYVDEDGANLPLADVGMFLSGFADPVGNFSEAPNKGYIQVVVPSPGGVASNEFLLVGGRFKPGTYTTNAAIEVVVTTDPNYVPKLAVSGDFDADLVVDGTDLGIATNNFTGAANSGTYYAKYYRHGDTDSDLDVDNADLGAIIGAYTPSASNGSATLTYNPTNGNVTLNATNAAGAIITSFQLENTAGTFVPGSFAGPAFGGTYQNVTTNVIGNTDTTLTGATGQIDLGNIFPTGLDLAGLQAYLKTAVYTGASGSRQQQLNLVVASGGSPPVASFTASAINGVAPLTVIFTDTSTGSPTSWYWDMNNDTIIDYTDPNPTNTFAAGYFTVSLIASNANGASSAYNTNITVITAQQSWFNHYGVAADNADPLGKGISNTNQFLAGFDPTNAAAYPHIISIVKSGADIVITYLGSNGDTSYAGGPAGVTNVVEYSTGTGTGGYTNWFVGTVATTFFSGGTGQGTNVTVTETGGATNTPSRYYRVRLLVP